MPDKIEFKVRTQAVEYGDRRKFAEYKIGFWHRGQLVGLESGQRRTATDRASAMKAAKARVAVLKTHRLFAIRVTRKHIADGEARNCDTCAIAQSLWHNQERMGFPKQEWSFEVSPYACFARARGIVLGKKYGADEPKAIPGGALPTVVFSGRDYRGSPDMHGESMIEWAMRWDDWAESRFISLGAWREKHSAEPDERPSRPGPSAFVLDLDAFQTTNY